MMRIIYDGVRLIVIACYTVAGRLEEEVLP